MWLSLFITPRSYDIGDQSCIFNDWQVDDCLIVKLSFLYLQKSQVHNTGQINNVSLNHFLHFVITPHSRFDNTLYFDITLTQNCVIVLFLRFSRFSPSL